jgi:hypothetical protein
VLFKILDFSSRGHGNPHPKQSIKFREASIVHSNNNAKQNKWGQIPFIFTKPMKNLK